MCRQRMLDRVASTAVVGVGCLPGHRLALHKRGLDDSAKADAFRTGNLSDATWGVVYRIDRRHTSILDQFESLGVGYDRVEVDIKLSAGESVRAWTYVARAEAIEAKLKPFHWYKDYLVRGAKQHGLPADYIETLESIEAMRDENLARRRMNAPIVNR